MSQLLCRTAAGSKVQAHVRLWHPDWFLLLYRLLCRSPCDIGSHELFARNLAVAVHIVKQLLLIREGRILLLEQALRMVAYFGGFPLWSLWSLERAPRGHFFPTGVQITNSPQPIVIAPVVPHWLRNGKLRRQCSH